MKRATLTNGHSVLPKPIPERRYLQGHLTEVQAFG